MSSPIAEIEIRKSSTRSENSSVDISRNKTSSASAAASAELEVNRQLQSAADSLLFVFPELRAALLEKRDTAVPTMMESSRPLIPDYQQQQQQLTRQTGVLWKRRDVFKNRWRPRWFSLNPNQGVLTYYLLNANTANGTVTANDNSNANATVEPTAAARQRTTSWDGSAVSGVSENSLDYDVVPRGTIYLLGCTVSINDALTRPRESLFAFTIRPPPHAGNANVHLAARTATTREEWVAQLDRVCRIGTANPEEDTDPSLLRRQSSRNLLTRVHSIPEGENSSQQDDVVSQDAMDDLDPGEQRCYMMTYPKKMQWRRKNSPMRIQGSGKDDLEKNNTVKVYLV